MVKILAVVTLISSGQVETLAYHERFPTMPVCEMALPKAVEDLYAYLLMLNIKRDSVTVEVKCVAGDRDV